DNNTGIEQRKRIHGSFYPPNDFIGFSTPLRFNKRRHVTSGSVFRLERAIVFLYYQLHDSTNKHAIPFYVCIRSKRLRYDEVDAYIFCMAEDNWIVMIVLCKKLMKVKYCITQSSYRESKFPEDNRSTACTYRTDSRKQTFAHFPEKLLLLWIFHEDWRINQRQRWKRFLKDLHPVEQLLTRFFLKFNKECRCCGR